MSVLDENFAKETLKSVELAVQLSELEKKYNDYRHEQYILQKALPDIVCLWLSKFGSDYIQSGGQYGKPYLAGRICSDMRAMLNAVLIGGMSPERMYVQICDADKSIANCL